MPALFENVGCYGLFIGGSYTLVAQTQVQSSEHRRPAFEHLHRPLQFFLQPHLISARHDFDASVMRDQRG